MGQAVRLNAILILSTTLIASLTVVSTARADIIRLNTGGELRGSIQSADDQQISITTLAGTTLSVPTSEVHFFLHRSELEEEYETRFLQTPNTAAAHWELAEWCRTNRLRAQRDQQWREVLLRDPNHAEARRRLEYIRDGVLWKTRPQVMRSRGYVRTRKKFITRQERDSIARTTAQKESETDWSRRISRIAEAVKAGDTNALAALSDVRDPMAISGLTAYFREASNPAARGAYVLVLGQIQHPAALAPLVEQAVFDDNLEVRAAAAGVIPEAMAEDATKQLVEYLEIDNQEIVQNTAAVLARVGHPKSLEPLIDALITQHQYSTRPSAAEEVRNRAVDLLNREDLTPAEVVIVMQSGLIPLRGVSATTEESNGRVQLLYPHRNPNVLGALHHLTGQNFGYDQRTWRLWLRAQGKRKRRK